MSFVYVLQLQRALAGEVVWVWAGGWRPLQIALVLVAVIAFLLGLRRYNMRQFLGLAQLCGGSGRGLGEGGGVDTGGILGLVRHPWYLAMLLLLWARNLQTADLVVNTVLMLYLVGGIVLEERKLVAAFAQSTGRTNSGYPCSCRGRHLKPGCSGPTAGDGTRSLEAGEYFVHGPQALGVDD